jgi:predicted nucleic acid-binding protein
MSLVVGDTTPLRYLVEIGYADLLRQIFTTIWVPGGVPAELRNERTPTAIRAWAEHPPSWIKFERS